MSPIYEATYVQGLHDATKRLNEISTNALEARRSDVRISHRPENERLLSVMFQMIFGKAAAYAVDYFGKNVTLQIIMDRTDSGLLREFREKATEFLDAGKPKQRELTGYDVVRKAKVTETATIQVAGPDVDRALGDFRAFSYDISCEDSGLTFAADIISNSIRHHLSKKAGQGVPVDLNAKEAISGHKLEHLFYGLSDGRTFESLTDIMYRHPKGNRQDPAAQSADVTDRRESSQAGSGSRS
ncbi:hypothetical protein AQ875_21455 [Burkholderia pseudomallei]|nr:hypothetical protein AQ875_21455 [Burkholderia pseudomallei]